MSRIPSNIPHRGIPKPTSSLLGTTTQPPNPNPPPPSWTELETKYKQDIEALTESAEMATIEKEIAEEKLDSCERELQELKDKLTEANLQIEMLRTEQQSDRSVGAGNSESTVTVLQLQKFEEQNEVLKQALIKLRDISAKDKKALEDLQIEHEELQLKSLDLEEKEQRYLEQIKIYEEQIDVNQSSQEMVEKLTQQKTDLEDKLKEMIEDFDCMEKLRDLNEQLLESARENEIEMTGKLDMLRVQCLDLNNKKRDLEDYLSDQEKTMSKLKDENRLLNEQVTRLKDQFKEGESIEQQKHQIENVAYKLNFSESKMAEKEAEINRCKRNLAEMEEQMNNLSLITKEQSAKLDELKSQFELKVSENAELQRALKKKMEEVSELEIRKDMAEKKLQSLLKEREEKIANLSRTIEIMKGIEVQHEEDMKRLMEDNEIIERERRDLRASLSKVDPARCMVAPKTETVDVSIKKVKALQAAFDTVVKRNYDLEMELAFNELNKTDLNDVYDIDRAKSLQDGVNKLKREIRAAMINQQICTKSRNVVSRNRADHFNFIKLATKYQALENEVSKIYR